MKISDDRMWLVLVAVSGLCSLLFFFMPSAKGQSVSLAWTAENDPNVIGYNIHFGTATGQYNQVQNVPGLASNSAKISTNLTKGQTYFFVVRAYNTNLIESTNSNEVSILIPHQHFIATTPK